METKTFGHMGRMGNLLKSAEILGVSVAILFSALTAHAGDKIIGGREVGTSDPAAATTVLVTDGSFVCTGSIIDVDLVVTAAHCVYGNKASKLLVVFSRSMDSATAASVHHIYGFKTAPGYSSDGTGKDQHDIALIRFKGAIPSGYAMADLLPSDESLTKGETVLLAGYGVSDDDQRNGAGTLRQVEVTVSDPNFGATEVTLDQSHGRGACHGDSGGPAFVESNGSLLLWGVTNRSYPDDAGDTCKIGVVYTRIGAYSSFISTSATALRKISSSSSIAAMYF